MDRMSNELTRRASLRREISKRVMMLTGALEKVAIFPRRTFLRWFDGRYGFGGGRGLVGAILPCCFILNDRDAGVSDCRLVEIDSTTVRTYVVMAFGVVGVGILDRG